MANRKNRKTDLTRGKVPGNLGQPAPPVPLPNLGRIQINNVFLPRSAEDYERLDRLDPGRTAKILQLQEDVTRANLRREENQTAHRIEIESKQQVQDHRSAWWGQVAAWSIAIVGLGCATYLGVQGQTTACIGVATSVCASIALAFIKGKQANTDERIKKMEMMLEAERGLRRMG